MKTILSGPMTLTLLLFCLSGSGTAHAESRRGHAHVHGAAEMNVSASANILEIEFRSPARDILGFEHVAATVEERRKVESAHETLKASAKMFAFSPPGSCEREGDPDVSVERESHNGSAETKRHGAHEDHDEHAEVTGLYRFRCRGATTVRPRVFELFPSLQTIHLQVVSDHKQFSATLNPESPAFLIEWAK